MDNVSLVAKDRTYMTQGGAGTRSARACLPWAMMFNAVGVRALRRTASPGCSLSTNATRFATTDTPVRDCWIFLQDEVQSRQDERE